MADAAGSRTHMASSHASRFALRPWLAPGLALAAVGALGLAGALGSLDRAWFDFLQKRGAAAAPIPADTALVLIDEQSMAAIGREPFNQRWPWSRGTFAALLTGLHRAGAKQVVVDLAFVEASEPEQDALLGAVAAGFPEVRLAALREEKGGATVEKLPAVWPAEFRAAHPALFPEGRARWGFANTRIDADGVIRRYRVGASLAEGGGTLTTPAAIRVSETPQFGPDFLLRWRGNLAQLKARGVPVVPAAAYVAAGFPLLDRATEAAPDLDPGALVKAIDAQPAPAGELFSLVRGRTVFVGANAAGTFDSVATPVGSPEPGVIVHWTALAQLRSGDTLADLGRGAGLLALLGVVGAIGWSGRRGIGLRNPGLAAGAAVSLALGGSAAGFFFGVWFAPALPVAGAAAAFTAVAVESFRSERARKREIQGWFGAYVSPAVVAQLVRNPDALKLGGERRELTVYFSDLAGFTTLSERLPPDQLVSLMNTFLEALSEEVLRHGCYLDKYIGDAIMAVFGSPEPLENHALAACRAALDSRQRLAVLNEQLAREHGVRLGMRIGINTGDMIVGNVGSAKKRNYTVLGDAVNLASRLEGANKEFGTDILLGPATAAALGGALVTRPLAHLQVKGKAQAVEVHELVGEPGKLDASTEAFLAHYRAGYGAFGARRFAEAATALDAAVALRPSDFSATRYLEEARRLAVAPPPADWQPILKLESK